MDRIPIMRWCSVAVATFVAAIILFGSAGYGQTPQRQCAKSISECPADGCGGLIDSELNRLKNRTEIPGAIKPYALNQFIALKKLEPQAWTANKPRGDFRLLENSGISIRGYLIRVRASSAETANCLLIGKDNVDWVLSIAPKPNDIRENSVTAEITPRLRPDNWDFEKLRELELTKSYIRITGWLLLDTVQLGRGSLSEWRATNWEVHPVSEIEICKTTIRLCERDPRHPSKNWIRLAEFSTQ